MTKNKNKVFLKNKLKNKIMKMNKKAFTLIELLIVIAIIAIIAAVVFVALDPLTRFQDARDSQRWSDVTGVLSAIKIDQVDNGGSYLSSINSASIGATLMIGTTGAAGTCTATTTSGNVDISGLVTEGYLGKVPYDPNNGSDGETDYYLYKDSTGIIKIGSCEAENAGAIEVSR